LHFGSTSDLAAPFLKKAILASLQFLFLLVTRLMFLCDFVPGMSSFAAFASFDPAEVEHVIDQIGEGSNATSNMPSVGYFCAELPQFAFGIMWADRAEARHYHQYTHSGRAAGPAKIGTDKFKCLQAVLVVCIKDNDV